MKTSKQMRSLNSAWRNHLNNEEVQSQTENLNEAPASVNTRMKSVNGFVYQWTIRDEKNSNLFFKIKKMEEKWLESGFTPVEQATGRFPIKPKEYVENRACPKCGSKLVYSIKKDGTKFIKCETNRWNAATKQAEGCSFIEWPNQNTTPSGHSNGNVEDY